ELMGDLGRAIVRFMIELGVIFEDQEEAAYRLFRAAVLHRRVDRLATSLRLSRRTLGRAVNRIGSPTASDFIQLAQMFRVLLTCQRVDDAPIGMVAKEARYSDGFTLSNQMHRVTGIRPTTARTLSEWRPFV